MKEGIIYIYTSLSNKVYVGQTTNPEQRKKQHRNHSLRNSGGCKYFYEATRKYGFDNFKYDILHTAIDETKEGLKEKLDFWEKFYISEYKSNDNRYGYNLTTGGGGGVPNEETRRKMSEMKKGKPTWNKGKKSVQSAWNKGKHPTEETRRKLSESHKGKSQPHLKLLWQTETGEIREMTIQNQRKYHLNWIQIN